MGEFCIDTASWDHVAYAYDVLVIESEARQDSICTYKCQSLDPLLDLLALLALLVQMR